MKRLSLIVASSVFMLVSLAEQPGFAQRGGGRGGGAAQPPDTRPVPRWPDGRINLGPVPGGQMGLWDGGATQIPLARPDVASDFGLFAADAREPADPFLAAKPKLSQIPFQPWARKLFDNRVLSRYDRARFSGLGTQARHLFRDCRHTG